MANFFSSLFDAPLKKVNADKSYDWHSRQLLKLNSFAERKNYIQLKISQAEALSDKELKTALLLICTDIASDLKDVFSHDKNQRTEALNIFNEAIEKYHASYT